MIFWGKVKRQQGRGKKLGFPTANTSLHKSIPDGIYVSLTKLGGREYKSVTFIGISKTFNEKMFQSETYILDFNKNLYGKWVSVKLLKKIRGNKKFKSADELVKQMKKDEIVTRNHFE